MIPRAYRQPAPSPSPVPEQYQAALARFDRSLGWKSAPTTRRLYVAAVERWLGAGGAVGHVDPMPLARFLADRRARCAPATVNLDLKALRAFYRFQHLCGDAAVEELAKIPRGRRPPRRLPRPLDLGALGELLGALPLDTFLGLRDYCLIRLALETGLRASELAHLELGDLLDDATVFVRAGKGGHDRYVPMTAALAGLLRGYVHARAGLRPGRKVALWLTQDGKPLCSGRSVWEIVSRRLHAGHGLPGFQQLRGAGRPWQGLYPHQLRATFATALLRNGCPITAIAQLMGHADVATTALYLGVDLQQLRAAMALHPRALRVERADDRRA